MTKARDIADFKFENIVDTGTEGTKVASGTTAQRGSTTGQIRFNSTTGLAEYYTGTSFKPIDSPPTVTNIDDTEVDSQAGGNQTIVITGSSFASGATVTFVGKTGTDFNASSVTVDSETQITAVAPKSSFLNAQEPYGVKVTNTSGLSSILADQINVDNSPAWQTASGTIYTGNDLTDVSVTVSATDPESDTISYSETTSVLSGAGLSLNSSTGAITGTPTGVSSDTTYTFTLRATANGKTADRQFSIVITDATVTTFSYTGGSQTFTPPSGVSSFIVYMWGAGGSGGSSQGSGAGGAGGAGAFVTTTVSNYTNQQQFGILVGQSNESTESTAINSFGGGGNGGAKLSQRVGGSGGGRSEINIGTVGNTPNGTRIVVAGGGGGGNALYESSEVAKIGGVGGHTTGGSGSGSGTVPTGGSQSAGGSKGSGIGAGGNAPTDGSAGIGGMARGGDTSVDVGYGAGGGGGGGYYGGGGGDGGNRYTNGQSGAGGSSYCNATYCSNTTYTSGSNSTAPETSHAQYGSGAAAGGAGRNATGSSGTAGGHGRVVIVY